MAWHVPPSLYVPAFHQVEKRHRALKTPKEPPFGAFCWHHLRAVPGPCTWHRYSYTRLHNSNDNNNYIYIYLYTHNHTHTHIYIYIIYIYIEKTPPSTTTIYHSPSTKFKNPSKTEISERFQVVQRIFLELLKANPQVITQQIPKNEKQGELWGKMGILVVAWFVFLY